MGRIGMERREGVGSSKGMWAGREFSYAASGKLAFGDQECVVDSGVGGGNVAAKQAAVIEGGAFLVGVGGIAVLPENMKA